MDFLKNILARRKKISALIVAVAVLLLGKVGVGPDLAGMIGEFLADIVTESAVE